MGDSVIAYVFLAMDKGYYRLGIALWGELSDRTDLPNKSTHSNCKPSELKSHMNYIHKISPGRFHQWKVEVNRISYKVNIKTDKVNSARINMK